MLPSPSSSPIRPTFIDLTNDSPKRTLPHEDCSFFLPTPPQYGKIRRPGSALASPSRRRKRIRVSLQAEEPSSEDEFWSGQSHNVFLEDVEVVKARARKRTVFAMRGSMALGRSHSSWNVHLPTRSILRTLVSSHKSDVFKCLSDDDDFLAQPYACSFSHGAKRGEAAYLAVTTEQGTVHIFNTAPRIDWDPEPPRTILRPHENGIFDVRWSHTDALLATCSGDHSVRVSDPRRADAGPLRTLIGASATTKCVAWRSENESVLAAGARNGRVLVWDLRSEKEDPVLSFTLDEAEKGALRTKRKKAKLGAAPSRSITSVLFADVDSYGLIGTSSHDGILRKWDFRLPCLSQPIVSSSPADPTTQHGSLRPRGLTSLVAGHGPSAGLLFALGADARVHAYAASTLAPLGPLAALSHPGLTTPSFYVRAALSPCGRWLGTGGSGPNPAAYAFDVASVAANAARGTRSPATEGVQVRGQSGEVGAVDWAHGALATCADDGTVRVWRPDVEVYRQCEEAPEEATWDYAWAV